MTYTPFIQCKPRRAIKFVLKEAATLSQESVKLCAIPLKVSYQVHGRCWLKCITHDTWQARWPALPHWEKAS